MLEVRMLKEDRVKPDSSYIHCLLIGALGRVGYTKKAFMLYNDIKRRGLKVHASAYTGLFNACANSPWLEDGLQRAQHLRDIILEAKYEPNDSNYNAMIKAFGRCGDRDTAFALVDEMAQKKLKLDDATINFLLQACISDKDAGFRHALLVWHKFVDHKIRPTLYSYNLMLRCIRDCGMGDIAVTNEVISKLLPDESLSLLEDGQGKMIGFAEAVDEEPVAISAKESVETEAVSSYANKLVLVPNDGNGLEVVRYKPQFEIVKFAPKQVVVENAPNLMAPVPHLGKHFGKLLKVLNKYI